MVEEALKKRPAAIAAGVDQYVPGLYNVPDHLAMNIVGPEGGPRRLTTDVDEINNYLQEQEKKGNAFMQQIVPAIAGIAAQLAIPVVPGVDLLLEHLHSRSLTMPMMSKLEEMKKNGTPRRMR